MAGWITEVDPAMLGVKGFLREDDRARSADSLEALNFGELFTFVRSAGRRLLDRANQRLLEGPVGECLAPDPYALSPSAPLASMPVVGILGSETHEYAHMTDALARWVAAQGFNLLTVCAPGVAHAAARAFALSPLRAGRSLGLQEMLPGVVEPRGGQEYVDVVVRVPAACRACHTRAASVFAVTAHVIVVLPGASARQLDGLSGAPVIAWADATESAVGPDSVALKRAFHASKLAEVTRYIERLLLADMPAIVDPGSDKDNESADDFEIVED